jgi:hypothetical protein
MGIVKVKYAGLCFILFLISALLICSILGCSREGMDDMEESETAIDTNKSSKISVGQRFESESGGSIEVISDTSIKVSKNMGDSSVTFTTTKPSTSTSELSVEGFKEYFTTAKKTMFYGPGGKTATIITNNGRAAIRVSYPDDTVYLYTNVDIDNSVNAASVTGPYGNSAYVAEGPEGEVVYGTTNGSPYYNDYNDDVNTASVTTATGPGGTTVGVATGPGGNSVAGISRSQIPPGTEDLYILKSQVVPPVCPACPVASACPRTEAPPPCPACSRCPEPSFECKKVPNYNAADINMLPMPVLTDFTSFGM